MKSKLFVLLVGINDYPAPISRLFGCIKDIERIESFLSSNYSGEIQLLTLKDEEATYGNIIQAFRTHLRTAGPEDTVWFHFSGHGAQDYTAREFATSVEPSGKEECLVCYRPDRSQAPYLLADKEIAVLLHEVATHGDKPSPPHIVVSLDCCHSGSGTRYLENAQIKPRSATITSTKAWQKAEKAGETRSFATYLDGYYEQNGTSVPVVKHILLSACERFQTAGDLPDGGIFTTQLIKVLEQAKGIINYTDLFLRARASTNRLLHSQWPKFEAIGYFDPYTRFLAGTPLGDVRRYEVIFDKDQTFIRCGAINGLPIFPSEPIALEIQTAAPGSQFVGKGEIIAVGMQKSEFLFLNTPPLQQHLPYQGIIRRLPADPVYVQLQGNNEVALQQIVDEWDPSKNIFWTKADQLAEDLNPRLAIEASENEYSLRDLHTGVLAQVLPFGPNIAKKVIHNLDKMVRWDRIRNLRNPKDPWRGQLILQMEIIFNGNFRRAFSEKEIRIYVTEAECFRGPGAQVLGFMPSISIQSMKEDLYCYLFHLRSNHSITVWDEEVPIKKMGNQSQKMIRNLYKKEMAWGMKDGENEVSSFFQLLVANRPLDYQQLLQGGLGSDRGIGAFRPVVQEKWNCLTMKINLIWLQASLSSNAPTKLANDQLIIQANDWVQAKVALSSTHGIGSSKNPATHFRTLARDNGQLLDFAGPENLLPQNVLELHGLKVLDPEKLRLEPLQIELSEQTGPQFEIVPLAFDGKEFRPIGHSVFKETRTIIYIRELPEVLSQMSPEEEWVQNPFDPEDYQHRSLYETVKIAFIKKTIEVQ